MDLRRLRRNPTVEEAPLQGEMMLFDATTSKFFILNPTMAVAWSLCDGQHSIASVAEAIVARFEGVDAEKAAGDVARAVDELKNLGLLLDAE